MEHLNFYMSGSHDENGNVIIDLDCEDFVSIRIKYNDPYVAQYIVSNLSQILSNMLEDHIEDLFTMNLDEELKKLIEEEGGK